MKKASHTHTRILCDSTHMSPLEESDSQRQEVDGGSQELGEERGLVFNGDRLSVLQDA